MTSRRTKSDQEHEDRKIKKQLGLAVYEYNLGRWKAEAEDPWSLRGMSSRSARTPVWDPTSTNNRKLEKKGKEKKNCILLKQRGRGGEGERDGEEEKGKWERGVGGEKRGSRGGKGGGGETMHTSLEHPNTSFPVPPFFFLLWVASLDLLSTSQILPSSVSKLVLTPFS